MVVETKQDEFKPGPLAPTKLPNLPAKRLGNSIGIFGGVVLPTTVDELKQYCQLMCKGDAGLPEHFRDKPGVCLVVAEEAMRWQMSPIAVAKQSFIVNGRIGYQAQLIAAIVKRWAPIAERVIPYKFDGKGDDMSCSITVHHAETGEEIFYVTPKIREITTKNSPLWKTDPHQQLGYYAIRAMARRHFPDILMGAYDYDEVVQMRDITPKVNLLEENPSIEESAIEETVTAYPDNQGNRSATEPEALPSVTPELVVSNLRKGIAACLTKGDCDLWLTENAETLFEMADQVMAKALRIELDVHASTLD